MSRSVLRASFDLARAGNFPSVASNVLAALVLSRTAGWQWPNAADLAWAILAGGLVYAGGATLNDVADAAFDRRHRPERTIPRGVIARAAAGWLGGIELALGAAILVAKGAAPAWIVGLVATILAYNWIHKRWVGAVILMAGCRVLLAVTVATLPGQAFTTPLLGWLAGLFVYIVVLSVIARREYGVAQAFAPAAVGQAGEDACVTKGGAKKSFPVGRLLAFIPLIDAIVLLLVAAWIPAMACAAAVPLGRWAQRLAAST